MPEELVVKLNCSFCDKNQREVRKLIAGPYCYICDECIKACIDILAGPTNPAEPSQQEASRREKPARCCSFCGRNQPEVTSLLAALGVD